jgi:hypothetical protein
MIKKAIEIKGIRKIVKSFYRKYDNCWSDLAYSFQWMLEDNNLSKMWVYIENERIIDFLYTSYIEKQIVISPYFLERDKITNELLSIEKKWGNYILEVDWLDNEKIGLLNCSFVSRINNNKIYQIHNSSCYYTNASTLVDYFVNYYEERYFPEIKDVNKISFKCIDSKDIYSFIKKDDLNKNCYPSWKDKYGHKTVIGFHYFIPEDSFNAKYIVAIYKDMIIGVIKVGKYGAKNDLRQSICYIDVCEKYRKRGIANKLIKKLAEYLEPEIPLVVTRESEMGAMCKMVEHFKNANYKVPVYSYDEYLRKMI